MLAAAQERAAAQEAAGQEQGQGDNQHGPPVKAPASAAQAEAGRETTAAAKEPQQQDRKACGCKQAASQPALPAAQAAPPAAEQAASGAAPAQPGAVPSEAPVAGAAPRAACCGRKRSAEGPADRHGAADSAVRRVVERMMRSGASACGCGWLVGWGGGSRHAADSNKSLSTVWPCHGILGAPLLELPWKPARLVAAPTLMRCAPAPAVLGRLPPLSLPLHT